MAHHPAPVGFQRARRELASAWASVVFVVAMLFGIIQVSESDSEYLIWFFAPAMLIGALLAIWFGTRARRDGEEAGRYPAAIGLTIGGFFTIMALIGVIGHFVLGME